MGLALCATTNAASWNWSIPGKAFSTSDGASERASGYYVAVFLYDDYASVSSALSGGSSDAIASEISSYIQSSGTTGKSGAASGKVSDSTETAGTVLTLFAVAFDAGTIAEAANYMISSTTTTEVYEGTAVPTVKGAFTADSFSGSTWTATAAVPEPGTAALALLGIGMLIRRRRA